MDTSDGVFARSARRDARSLDDVLVDVDRLLRILRALVAVPKVVAERFLFFASVSASQVVPGSRVFSDFFGFGLFCEVF